MTMTNTNDTEIMEKGMNCLLQNLGPIDTARFIFEIKRGKTDDTKMRDFRMKESTFEHGLNSFSDDYLEEGRPEQSCTLPEADLNP